MTDFTVDQPGVALSYGEKYTWSIQVRDGSPSILTDPTSSIVNITFTDPTGSVTIGPVATDRNDIGLYSYSYTLPSNGPSGSWIVSFTYNMGGDSPIKTYKFEVEETTEFDYTITPTSITIAVIRGYLGYISQNLLPNAKVQMNILKDSVYIDKIKSPKADADVIMWAKITLIGKNCYAWYTANHERAFSEEQNTNNQETLAELDREAIKWELLASQDDSTGVVFDVNNVGLVVGKSVSTLLNNAAD